VNKSPTRVLWHIWVPVALATLVLAISLFPSWFSASKSNYAYGTRNLSGASPEQVGQFAVEYATAQGNIRSGQPQVLLVKSVTRDEVAPLGLGCLPDFNSNNDPPLTLVIMKGSFKLGGGGGTSRPFFASYLAYVFDVWSAEPVVTLGSGNGAQFRKILNDPNLPSDTDSPISCPTRSPRAKDVPYGVTAPTRLPESVPTTITSPTATPPIPLPVATTEIITPRP
jgi:hypothetical protein